MTGMAVAFIYKSQQEKVLSLIALFFPFNGAANGRA